MSSQIEPLIDVREHEDFLKDKGLVETALTRARQFAGAAPFQTREEAGAAADAIKELRNIAKDAEERKKGITVEWRVSTNAVNTQYNELLSPLGAAEQALKQKGLAFKKAEEAKAREAHRQELDRRSKEAEEKLREANEAAELAAQDDDPDLQRLADETRQDAAAAAVSTTAPVIAPPKQVRGSHGALGTRTVYRFEVTDFSQVPEEFKVISDPAIKAEVNAEAAAAKVQRRPFDLEIPGVRIYPDEIPVSR